MFEETNKYFVILSLLSFFFILFLIREYILEYYGGNLRESFIQEPPFIVKRNENTYDEFSSKIYDKIFHPEKESYYIVDKVFNLTEPNPEFTTILDIGCGTGELLHHLDEKGYTNIYGLDKSLYMASKCIEKYNSLKVKVGDTIEPMTFEKSSFTHIFCVGMTIYEIKDKITFFRNCYFWLKPNSFLILHLVNRNSFNTIIQVETPILFGNIVDNNPQQYSKTRITNTEVDFNGFKYKSSYDFTNTDIVVFTETFIDKSSSKIRKNERELYMSDDMNSILYDAQYCGFIVTGQITYGAYNGDENQFIIILERPN